MRTRELPYLEKLTREELLVEVKRQIAAADLVEQINAAPEPLRSHVQLLETDADPGADYREEIARLRAVLSAMYRATNELGGPRGLDLPAGIEQVKIPELAIAELARLRAEVTALRASQMPERACALCSIRFPSRTGADLICPHCAGHQP